jgi:excisionase family DNA binding protein
VKTVAERCDVSESKVYDLISSGLLPAVQLGQGLLRVPEVALTYLAERNIELVPELF